ncbi:para-aminobenzoate synthase, (PABA) [Elasticomyces elasticus]|nr:para-aminobenzoate synthase, (PABA) [Elasticomyces elasticus]KAK3666647.1 para-aminobenzoate synthase, (PABA) [Elasticomyces elasticus]KAK4921660.1 para-aminobenzoate synthase, (PABA) [Elasticomyces elasticus]KAK5758604.1 para-aminobenzoate synthase, (PABA) [Elasticomyces elasticus]
MPKNSILYIDAYDSFSNNIIALLRDNLPVTVESIKIDDSRFVLNDDVFQKYLNNFNAVVAGPGPGHPANSTDVGLIGKLWTLPDECTLPVLGICLGFQNLALAFGGDIERLNEPRHGLVRHLTHCDRDIFSGIGELDATQYHSLHVRLSHDIEVDHSTDPWTPARKCKQLVPLAWDLSDLNNGPILMAAWHCHKPFWGVQYHPESVCSSGGSELIQNWWAEASRWNAVQGRQCDVTPPTVSRMIEQVTVSVEYRAPSPVGWRAVPYGGKKNVADLVNILRVQCERAEPILLESGVRDFKPVNPETGRFSIIGLPTKDALQLRWSTKDRLLTLEAEGKVVYSKQMPISGVYAAVESIMTEHKASHGPTDVPFWGGLVGYMSYEAGLESIDVPPAAVEDARPDVWFMLVERSVVVDHVKHCTYIQSLSESDEVWLDHVVELVQNLNSHTSELPSSKPDGVIISGPNKAEYCAKVNACQKQLRAGESYELCLTDQTLIRNSAKPWALYQRLREANPAPFGAYLHFADAEKKHELDLISSSPERFLSWSRGGKCQFRPIKGTVKKEAGMTRKKAEEILRSEKERAENLMIVDLIRHDLNGVEGVRDVCVPKLMQVEEYATVYQLVSVIEGQLDTAASTTAALANSLPPGSMTGAPKKRSCELLGAIEAASGPRGLYSGVLGYFDVGGGGDFSVIIRSAFKWSEDGVWTVGAGGAVTALSEPDAEWEEMLAKRQSLMDVLLASS